MNYLPEPDEYRGARPFPHAVIDEYVTADAAAVIAAEFPPRDASLPGDQQFAWHHFSGEHEEKWQMSDPRCFGAQTKKLLAHLLSVPFVADLENVTGIDGLRGSTFGGGYHLIDPGGFLHLHVDSLHDPDGQHWETDWYRCVNLLLFLSDNEHWSAELDLTGPDGFNGSPRGGVKCISPKPGRMVIFTTDGNSFHGHPEPLRGGDRRSLAVYYYRETPPPGYTGDQPTTFVTP